MHYDNYSEQPGLLQSVHDALHLTSPIQLQKLVLANFVDAIRLFPVAYIRYVGDNLDPFTIGDALFDRLFSYNEFFQLGAHQYATVLLTRLAALLRTVATTVCLLTPAGIPYIFMKQRTHQQHPTHELAASGLLLASAVAVAGLFALIHLETRYRLVVTPESLGAAAFVGHTLAVRRSERLAQVALPSGPPTV